MQNKTGVTVVQNRSRRQFFRTVVPGALGAAYFPTLLRASDTPIIEATTDGHRRAKAARDVREDAALAEYRVPIPAHRTNGDEKRYATKIGSYHKGLPHNNLGEVDLNAYETLTKALETGDSADFDAITMGGNQKLVDPQGGLAFDMEGTDSHQLRMEPPPRLSSAQTAGDTVELYWMALLRDVNFTDYATDPSGLVTAALADLNALRDFRGPKQNGQVTAQTLFREFTPGDVVGPYVSQFLLQPVKQGALAINQTYGTYLPGIDYMTDPNSWLAVQNGAGPFGSNSPDPTPRYIRNGRDVAAYVHVDGPFQAYITAAQWLLGNKIPLNPGNPYLASATQSGFETFGAAHILSMIGEVSNRALKSVWFQKWFVHRRLRPEAFGGLVHWTKIGVADYPVHRDVLNSTALQRVFDLHSTYLLPQAYPEGSPQHPSYGQGHGSIAGACVTLLKAFFNTDNVVFPNPVVASEDGLTLVPYAGSDAGQITLTGELHKLAGNIANGRNHAGIHYRSDNEQAILLGEAVAISILKDSKRCYNEAFAGFTFKKFDGSQITV
jgi:hypothetical protein